MEPTVMQPAAPPSQKMFRYAGFWKRFVAYIIDQIILSIICIIILVPVLGMLGLGLWSQDFDPSAGFLVALIGAYMTTILLLLVAEWLYYALMESKKGATLGKMALGILVTDMDGNRISFARATGRYFGKILSSLIFGIGYIMAGFTAKKQALHDMVASCLVINK